MQDKVVIADDPTIEDLIQEYPWLERLTMSEQPLDRALEVMIQNEGFSGEKFLEALIRLGKEAEGLIPYGWIISVGGQILAAGEWSAESGTFTLTQEMTVPPMEEIGWLVTYHQEPPESSRSFLSALKAK